jgi:DNA-binding NarL/FixJ family response regulator
MQEPRAGRGEALCFHPVGAGAGERDVARLASRVENPQVISNPTVHVGVPATRSRWMADEPFGSQALVGRERELGAVDRILGGLSARRGRFLEVRGEPGIGKTRLLTVVVEGAEARRYLVLTGRAAEFERDVPFGVMVDALDDHLAAMDPRELERLSGGALAELARVFPALAHSRSASHGGLQEERYRAHRAVRALLGQLARQRPLVLVLDDVHWADAASVELLEHLLRRPPVGQVLLVLAFRSGQVPEPFLESLHAAQMEGGGDRLELGPLSPAAVGELLGETVDRWTRERLQRETGGNPFYLEQLARASGRQGPYATALPGGQSSSVPERVMSAIGSELAALPASARVALQSAAVIGEPFAVELVAATSGLPEVRALSGIDVALARGLIRPVAIPRLFLFRHPIVRRAAYQSAPAGWRVGAHGRAAAALEAAGAPLVAYAHHVERSARGGDERAVAVLAAAAEASALRAPATAAHWLHAALRLLPEQAPVAARLELLVPLATALGAAGELERSRATLREVLGLLGPEAGYVRARVVGFIAMVEHLLGEHDSATRLLRNTLEGLVPCSPEAAELTFQLAWDLSYRGEYAELGLQAARAHELAVALADRPLMAATGALLALAHYNVGAVQAAHEAFRGAHEIVTALADDELAGRLDAFILLGWVAQYIERFDDGLCHLERGLAISRTTGQGYLYVPMLIGAGMIHTWQGDLRAATQLAEDATDVARLSRNEQSLTWALSLRAWVATLAGDFSLSLRVGEAAIAAGAGLSHHYYSMIARCNLAEARLEDGDPARCVKELLAAAGGPALSPIERPFRPHFYEILTRAELARGDLDAAAGWAKRAQAAAAGRMIAGRQAEALRARAAVHLARGRAGAAATLARAAAEAALTTGNRVDAARARLLAGTALTSAGRREQALEQLELAHSELAACGARRRADHAAHELRRLGRRVPRRGKRGSADTGLTALSGREREVADLVATGMTNRQIAAELFLSEKTIEGYLANVFVKLGVSARAAVAAQVGAEPR